MLALISPGALAQQVSLFHPQSEVLEAIDFIFNMQREKADSIAEQMIARDPDTPVPYFLKSFAAYYDVYVFKVEDAAVKKTEFWEIMKKAEMLALSTAEKFGADDPRRHENLLILSGVYGYMGFVRMREHSYFSALKFAKKGYLIAEKIVLEKPDFYDAYLAVGGYNYFVGKNSLVVRALLTLLLAPNGNRDLGLKQLQVAQDRSTFMKVPAAYILSFAYYAEYFEKGEDVWLDRANHVLDSLRKRYPNNFIMQIFGAICYYEAGRFEEAREILTKENQRADRMTSRYNVLAKTYLARVELKLGHAEKALEFLETARVVARENDDRYELYFVYGEYYEQNHQTGMALQYYQKVVDLGEPPSKRNEITYRAAVKKVDALER